MGVYQVPSFAGTKTFSFLGVKFDSPIIARVRITSSSPTDEAAMDDFIYGEPTATPEPATWATLATAVVGLAMMSGGLCANSREISVGRELGGGVP